MHTDRPAVIDDNEPDSADDGDENEDEDGGKDKDKDEAEATRGSVGPGSAEQDANLYNALLTQNTDPELCKPIIPSGPERWYDVEAGCYIDEELPLGLEPKVQEDLTTSIPAQDHPFSPYYNNDRNT
jgi:hypothetical protein